MKKTIHYKKLKMGDTKATACGIELTERDNKITIHKKHYRDIHVTRRIEKVNCKKCKNTDYYKKRKG